jgi:hypothetical protein
MTETLQPTTKVERIKPQKVSPELYGATRALTNAWNRIGLTTRLAPPRGSGTDANRIG